MGRFMPKLWSSSDSGNSWTQCSERQVAKVWKLCLKGLGPWGLTEPSMASLTLRLAESPLWMNGRGFPDFPEFSALVAGRGEGVTEMGPEGTREVEKVVHLPSGRQLLPKAHT